MASGDTLLIFHPYNNEPPSSAYATLDLRNQHPVLDFDKDTDESAVFSDVMPQNYSAVTGITVYIHWSGTNFAVNEVVWDVAFERVGTVLDVDGDGFAAVNSVTDTVAAPTGVLSIASIAFTNGADMDSIEIGEKFRVKITRDANNGDDDFDDDAELHMIEIRET